MKPCKFDEEDALDFQEEFMEVKYDEDDKTSQWATINMYHDKIPLCAWFMAYKRFDDAMRLRITQTNCGIKASRVLLNVPIEELPLHINEETCNDCECLNSTHVVLTQHSDFGVCARVARWRLKRGK